MVIVYKRCIGHLHYTVLKHGRIIQQGSYATLLAVDGYFKDLVTSGLGEFSSTIEEQLKQGKSHFSLEHREEIDNLIRVDNQDAYVLGKIQYRLPEVSTFKLGIQGWRLLFTVLKASKVVVSISFDFYILNGIYECGLINCICVVIGIQLHCNRDLLYLSLAIVGVRFFGVSRAVCRYF